MDGEVPKSPIPQRGANPTARNKQESGSGSGSQFQPRSNHYNLRHTETHNTQRAAAMEEVRRILLEEVRTDWVDAWEERWKRRLDELTTKKERESINDNKVGEDDIEAEEESGNDGNEKGDEKGHEDEELDRGGKGERRLLGKEAEEEEEEKEEEEEEEEEGEEEEEEKKNDDEKEAEIWLNRGDDSDFLKVTDTYSLPFSSPPHADGHRTDRSNRESWMSASMNRLMGTMGLSSHSHPHHPSQPQLRSSYPSSPTTPSLTAATTPTTISANQSAPGSPPITQRSTGGGGGGASNPYRFASPESIIPSLDLLREQKKKELEKQMDLSGPEGNVGLRCWMERRDWWTGADNAGRVKLGKSKFADNILTSSVNETAYPAIYTKCIKKALPPVVPINLRHITNAMVAGWKKDGEWPPPPSAPEPSFSRRKHSRGGGGW